MATTVAQMNTLSDRLDGLADRLTTELNVELRQERRDAKGDAELLAAIDKRETDLRVGLKMHKDAKTVYMAAKAAYKVNPAEMDARYAEALVLAAKLEAVLDYRATDDSDKSKTDTKADPDKGKAKDDDKDKKETTDDAAKKKDKKDPKEKVEDDESEILKTLKALTASCDKNHTDAMGAIQALEPRLIEPELAKVLNSLTPDQLWNVINRRGVAREEAAILEALAANFTADDILAILKVQDAGFMDRFRFVIGNGAHR